MHPLLRLIPLCTICLGLGFGLAWFRSLSHRETPPHAAAPATSLPPAAHEPATASPPVAPDSPPPASAEPPAESTAPEPGQEAAPLLADEARTRLLAEMEAAYTTYDPAALPRLTPRLRHPDPEIRAFARESIVQLGHAEGASALRAAARAARDPREATALLEAAEFLELPPAAPVGTTPFPPVAGQTRRPSAPPSL